MKKLGLIILLVAILLPLIGIFSHPVYKVVADEYGYSYACGLEYEVDHIEDDGSFKKISCHSDFASAKKKMKENDDYVVRHYASYSPSKIIAMNSGLAYSYPARSGSSIMDLYSKVPSKGSSYKTTYVSNHYEMTYVDTERYLTGEKYAGMGIVEVVLNGFSGFTDLENVDLVPSKYIEKGIPLYLGGNDTTADNEAAFKVICKYSYYSIVKKDKNLEIVFNYYRAYSSSSDYQPYSASFTYGPAADFMEEGKKYYSADGYNFYKDASLKEFAGTYYNYYQYLPLRSKTNIEASQFDAYLIKTKGNDTKSVLKNKGSAFIESQDKYGVNALLVYAMACHEAAYGTSSFALNRYNLFGYAAYDASPSSAYSYNSVEHCVSEHMGHNLRWYMDIESSKFFSSSLGNKGSGFNVKYASDPYWGMKIAGIAYKIDKYTGFKDLNSYDLAVLDDDTDIYYDDEVVYNSNYGNDYQLNFMVIVNDIKEDYATIQFTNGIDSNGKIIAKNSNHVDGLVKYDFDRSQVQVKTKNLISINYQYEEPVEEEIVPFVSVRKVSLVDNILKVNGIGLFKKYDFKDKDNIKYYIEFYDYNDNLVYSYLCETLSSNGFSLNDGYDYSYSTYELNLDVSEIKEGNYRLSLHIVNGDKEAVCELSSSNSAYAYLVNGSYVLSTDELHNYRLCLDAMSNGFDYSQINKPSTRQSLFSFDSIEINDELILNIKAHALIYYVDFKDDVTFEAYLVADKDNVIKMNVEASSCPIDYRKALNSSYKLDGICFNASTDIKDLKGEYKLYLKIINGSYIDIIEMTNHSLRKTPVKEANDSVYSIMTSPVRDSLYLKVE